MEEVYTILEVSNLLEITTQAVYKRLQIDKEDLKEFETTKGGKKSLTKEGVEKLAELMGIANPFNPVVNIVDNNTNAEDQSSDPQVELLSYLREDNQRLLKEVENLKAELIETRSLRESDKRNADEERRQHEEARMRADTLLMKAMMNQEQPRLLERIFGKKKQKENKNNNENPFE